MGNRGVCRGCGADILWVKTEAGKNMPCDPRLIPFREQAGGRDRAVTMQGKVVCCELRPAYGTVTGIGYVPHFATCPVAGKFKRK